MGRRGRRSLGRITDEDLVKAGRFRKSVGRHQRNNDDHDRQRDMNRDGQRHGVPRARSNSDRRAYDFTEHVVGHVSPPCVLRMNRHRSRENGAVRGARCAVRGARGAMCALQSADDQTFPARALVACCRKLCATKLRADERAGISCRSTGESAAREPERRAVDAEGTRVRSVGGAGVSAGNAATGRRAERRRRGARHSNRPWTRRSCRRR